MFFWTKHKEVHCFLEKFIRKQQFCFPSSFLGTFFWVSRTFQCDHFHCGCNSNIFPVSLQGFTNIIFFINQKPCLNVSVKCMENCVPLSSHFSEKMFLVYFFELRIKCHLIVRLFLTSMWKRFFLYIFLAANMFLTRCKRFALFIASNIVFAK